MVVRTLILSDLHLGSGGDIDLLRRPELRETLWVEVEGVDEVVLLGDAVELRDRRWLRPSRWRDRSSTSSGRRSAAEGSW